MQVGRERHGLVPERGLGQDLHEAFFMELLHRRVDPRPRDLGQRGDLAGGRRPQVQQGEVHPGLVLRQPVVRHLPKAILVDGHANRRRLCAT